MSMSMRKMLAAATTADCPVAGPGLSPKIQADAVYLNGRIYTLDS